MDKLGETVRKITVAHVDFVNTYRIGVESYPLENRGRYRCGLFLTVEGDECYRVLSPDKQDLETRSGYVFFLPQGAEYKITETESLSDVRVIDFTAVGDVPLPFAVKTRDFERVKGYFAEAERQWNLHSFAGELACRGLVYRILSLVSEEGTKDENFREGGIGEAVRFLHEHYTESGFRIEDLPAIVGMSHRWFNRLFEERFGCTPRKYVTELRISRAKELLMNEKLPIDAIAESLGFCDAFYFHKVFKRETGLTPVGFRTLHLVGSSISNGNR